ARPGPGSPAWWDRPITSTPSTPSNIPPIIRPRVQPTMPDLTQPFDVLVVGGGNAALCAAITAKRGTGSVLLLESAPQHFRGGNSRHTRDSRYMHQAAN